MKILKSHKHPIGDNEMKRFSQLLMVSLGMSLFANVSAEDQTTTVWTTDFSGKPPYQRSKDSVRNVDLAQFETQKEIVVNNVDFRGKPPYTRNTETVRVVDLAQFETQKEDKFVATPRRMKMNHIK